MLELAWATPHYVVYPPLFALCYVRLFSNNLFYEFQVCDWPHNVNCSNSGGGGGGGGEGGGGEGGGGGGENGEDEDCDDEVEFLPNGCPADFNVHFLLPHESNCSRYYQCVFGNVVERECAPGTHFNAALQVCS